MWASLYQSAELDEPGTAVPRARPATVSRSMDCADVKALKALEGSTGIQAGWQRRSVSRCMPRSPIRDRRPKPIRKNNAAYHQMFQAYLDTGEESLADLDPNSVSSHFLRSAVPKSAVMDGRASTFGGFPSAEDTEDEQLRLYTCNSTGFLCDTSSFLRVSALSPTRERRGTPSKTPPQTAPSSLQTAGVWYGFPTRTAGQRHDPDVWRCPEDDALDIGRSPRVPLSTRSPSRLSTAGAAGEAPAALSPRSPKQPITINEHPANAYLEAPDPAKTFPAFREGRLHSARVRSMQAARSRTAPVAPTSPAAATTSRRLQVNASVPSASPGRRLSDKAVPARGGSPPKPRGAPSTYRTSERIRRRLVPPQSHARLPAVSQRSRDTDSGYSMSSPYSYWLLQA